MRDPSTRPRIFKTTLLLGAAAAIATAAGASETITYSYDARGRLKQVARSGTVNNGVVVCYALDKADNRTNVTVSATPDCATFILYAGQSTSSPDGRFVLAMQTDGNLVLYGPDGAMWWTLTNGGGDRRMVMQSDGNLVVYNGANQALWSSNTAGNPGSRLVLQNDGNLVIYNASDVPIWHTNTAYQPPSFSIGNAVATEGGTLTFTVTRSKTTIANQSVNFATANGTAGAGSDYTAASGTLTFAPSETSKTVNVSTIDDALSESAETLSVNLSGATGSATIGQSQGVGTINDNEAPPNQPPVGNADSASVAACGSVDVNVIANDTDPDGNYPLSLVNIVGAAQGWASVVNSTTLNFSTSRSNTVGSVTYTLRDSLGATATGNVSITIRSGVCQ